MYLDPAFGGMLLQVIIAIVAVGGGIVYSFRRKIKAFFSKNKNETKKVGEQSASDNTLGAIDAIDEMDEVNEIVEEDKDDEEKSDEVIETV